MAVALRAWNAVKVEDGIDTSNIIEEVDDNTKGTRSRASRRRRRRGDEEEKHSEEETYNEFNDDGTLKTEGTLQTGNGSGRPFELVAGLPCSLDVPQYNSALTFPLSVRDSGVLYSSLLSSRRTWISGEMFEVYWTRANKVPSLAIKDESIIKELESSKEQDASGKDRMQRMCDCELMAGPHTFSIKLFIVKDDEKEKKWQEEQEYKKKEKEEQKKLESEQRKKRAEEKKQMLQLKKQEREKQMQLQKEARARAKKEQAEARQRQKEEERQRKLMNKERVKEQKASTSKPKKEQNKKNSDQHMIANLNIMAQRDPELKKLMAKVANGQANMQEIEEFKRVIELAKNLPPPGTPPAKPEVQKAQSKPTDINETSTDSSKSEILQGSKTNESDKKGTAEQATEPQTHSEENKPESESQSRDNSEKSASSDNQEASIKKETDANSVIKKESSDGDGNKSQQPKRKYNKAPKVADELTEKEKEMQLTAFQQKYVTGAELVLEFAENTNFRFLLPKKAIIQYIPESNRYKMSWLQIHNQSDITRFYKRQVKELTRRIHNAEEKQRVTDEYNVFRDKKCPSPLFSSMTVTFSGIHVKFNSIMMNSFDPKEEVRGYMEDVLAVGTRLSGYNLWYQLDGYDDRELAERLRSELNEYEQSLKPKRQKKQ